MKTFRNYDELTTALVAATIERVATHPAIKVAAGYSNVSSSAYVNVELWSLDEDGDRDDVIDEIKVRFSDHGDRYGSDVTLRIDELVEDIEDDGEHIETRISTEDFDALVVQALAAINEFIEENE